jgi:HSP20 family molecular chaperone IbpA
MKISNLIPVIEGKPNHKETFNKVSNFPAVNVSETKETLKIVLEVPGYTHEDIAVYAMGSRLSVSGSRKENATEKSKIPLSKERINSFRWVYDLKLPFRKEDLTITIENGFLFITLIKSEKVMLPVKNVPVLENYLEDNFYFPRANVVESESHLEMALEIPGYKTEDVFIDIKDTSLMITGKRKFELYNKGEQYHRIEIPLRNSFMRMFELPDNINKSQASWHVQNGVMFVFLPKLKTILKEEVERESMFA